MQLRPASSQVTVRRPEWARIEPQAQGSASPAEMKARLLAQSADKLALWVGSDRPQDLKDLRAALEQSTRRADLLVFSQGQSLEAAYELRKLADFQVGAQSGKTSGEGELAGLSAEQAARGWVRTAPENTIHSALRTSPLEKVAQSVRGLVRELIDQKVDPDQIYASLLRTPAMSRNSLEEDSHLRDLGAFLSEILANEAYPESVREAAVVARRQYEACVVDRRSTPQLQALRATTGATVSLPWKALSEKEREQYRQLDWSRDSGWGDLLDYVLAPRPQAPSSSPAAGLAGWLHREYKRYISPELEVRCGYQQSCSNFARQAIEEHGWLRGSYAGLLRFLSCDGSAPEPSCDSTCSHPATGASRLQPPSGGELSRPGRLAIQAGKVVGGVLGGALLGLVALPLGASWGALTGWKSAAGTLEQHRAHLGEQYGPAVARGHARLSAPLQPYTEGSRWSAALVGGALGAVGAVLGGARWGAEMGSLWLGNRLKDSLGQLPPNPRA